MKTKLIAALLGILLAFSPLAKISRAEAREDGALAALNELIEGITGYNLRISNAKNIEDWISDSLAKDASGDAEWYAMALSNYQKPGVSPAYADALSVYADALSARLATALPPTAVARQKYALALIAMGRPEDPFVAQTLENSAGGSGIMGYIFRLHLLTNSPSSFGGETRDVIRKLVSLALPGGGWALSGTNPDPDITAMALQALAPYYPETEGVKAAAEDALALLGEKQLPDGGFSSYGFSNAESAAQVILALTSLGIDPAEDGRFDKNGANPYGALLKHRLPDGSFCHTEGGNTSPAATVQACCALVSLWRFYSDLPPFYCFGGETGPHDRDTSNSSETPSQSSSSAKEQSALSSHAEGAEKSAAKRPSSPGGGKTGTDYKMVLGAAVILVFIAVSLTLFLKKKYKLKHHLPPLLLAAAGIILIFTLKLQSPDDYYGSLPSKTEVAGVVTMGIRCGEIAGEGKNDFVPADGVILPETPFEIARGDTVYDILVEGVRRFSLHMEKRGVAGYGYVAAINYIYEYEYGDLSGWRYLVNGSFPTVGCMEFVLSDGDRIEWVYTKNLGGYVD